MRLRAPFAMPAGLIAGLVLAVTAACGSDQPGGGASSGPAITVNATDTACTLSRTELPAGTATFTITNGGAKVTEFYVYGDGDKVLGEVENIGPGVSRDLHVVLAAGTYQAACKPGMTGTGIRTPLTVTATGQALPGDARLAEAAATYQRYVQSQTGQLLARTEEFVAAVKAGDVARAKALYPVARTYWERIEPVAEIFGDLDPKIDGREDVVAEGKEFTGFHRIERDLWVTGDLSQSGPVADRLLADVREIVAKANAEQLNALQLANGAKELLDEVATGKITGEENRYSHTDLWDFAANVEGSRNAITALRPLLQERDPTLVTTLDERFAAVDAALRKHAVGDGWKLHTQLSPAELKDLSDAINALGEPVSRVAGVISGR